MMRFSKMTINAQAPWNRLLPSGDWCVHVVFSLGVSWSGIVAFSLVSQQALYPKPYGLYLAFFMTSATYGAAMRFVGRKVSGLYGASFLRLIFVGLVMVYAAITIVHPKEMQLATSFEFVCLMTVIVLGIIDGYGLAETDTPAKPNVISALPFLCLSVLFGLHSLVQASQITFDFIVILPPSINSLN